MNTHKIPFGLINGRMVSAGEVPRGLACGCICSECHGELVAKHPMKGRVKHFAHYRAHDCVGAYETSIHKTAKQLISESGVILVPELTATAFVFNDRYHVNVSKRKTIPSRLLAISDVQEEYREYSGIVPDIAAEIDGRLIFIEITVTHPTGAEKLERLKQLGHPTFEIKLSKLSEIPSKEELRDLVVNCPTNRQWLYNPRQAQLEDHVNSLAETELQRKVAEYELRQANYDAQKNKYRALSDSDKLRYDLKAMGVSWGQVSKVAGHNVSCAFAIKAPPETWQLSIYRRFIHNQTMGSSFNKDEVNKWVVERFELKISAKIRDAWKIAIYHYLQELVGLKVIVKEIGYGDYAVYEGDYPT